MGLGSQLIRMAAEIQTTLPPGTTGNYRFLKEALFRKTADGYRLDFHSAKIREGEGYQRYFTYFTQLFQFWLDASEVGDGVPALKQFIVLDQFLESPFLELWLLVEERLPQTLKEAAQLGEDWAPARNSYSTTRSKKSVTSAPSSSRYPSSDAFSKQYERPSSSCIRRFNYGQADQYHSRCSKNTRTFKEADSNTTGYSAVFFPW